MAYGSDPKNYRQARSRLVNYEKRLIKRIEKKGILRDWAYVSPPAGPHVFGIDMESLLSMVRKATQNVKRWCVSDGMDGYEYTLLEVQKEICGSFHSKGKEYSKRIHRIAAYKLFIYTCNTLKEQSYPRFALTYAEVMDLYCQVAQDGNFDSFATGQTASRLADHWNWDRKFDPAGDARREREREYKRKREQEKERRRRQNQYDYDNTYRQGWWHTRGGQWSQNIPTDPVAWHRRNWSHIYQTESAIAQDQTWYTVLGVDETAPADEIRKAYRDLMKKHHTDKGGDVSMAQAVIAAFRVAERIRGL